MEDHEDTEKQQGEPKQVDLVEPPAEIAEPVAEEHDAYGDHKLQDWNETKKPWRVRRKPLTHSDWIQILIFIAASVYCGLTYRMWDTTREGIHSGQRAYLLIKNVRLKGLQDICTDQPKYGETNVGLVPGTPMWLLWDVENGGQTPAFDIRQAFRFYIGKEQPRLGDGDRFGGISNVLGPGECDPAPDAGWIWLDHDGTRHWTEADAQRLQQGERLWVVVSIKYRTAFDGVEGASSYCGYYDNSLFTSCGNEVK